MNSTKNRGGLRLSGRISSSYFTSDIRHVAPVSNPVRSDEWGKDWEVLTTSVT